MKGGAKRVGSISHPWNGWGTQARRGPAARLRHPQEMAYAFRSSRNERRGKRGNIRAVRASVAIHVRAQDVLRVGVGAEQHRDEYGHVVEVESARAVGIAARALDEPGPAIGRYEHEIEQHSADLGLARGRWVRAVVVQVGALPNEAVATGRQSVGP